MFDTSRHPHAEGPAWKSWPVPNPWFAAPERGAAAAGKFEASASWLFWTNVALLTTALLILPVTHALYGKMGFNYPAWVFMAAWVLFLPLGLLRKRVLAAGRAKRRDIIGCEFESAPDRKWVPLLISILLCPVGLLAAIVVAANGIGQLGKSWYRLTWVENGRVRRATSWLPNRVMDGVAPGTLIWLTRPGILLPAGVPDPRGRVEPGTLVAPESAWLLHLWMKQRCEQRGQRQKVLLQRAKRIAKLKPQLARRNYARYRR
jgi:hypothetical protein